MGKDIVLYQQQSKTAQYRDMIIHDIKSKGSLNFRSLMDNNSSRDAKNLKNHDFCSCSDY